MRARLSTITTVIQRLAGLVAMITTTVLISGSVLASSFATSPDTVVATATPGATEEILATARLVYPPAGAVRTQAQLIVPADAHWETEVGQGSVLLTVASGALTVTIDAGTAHASHHATPASLHDLTPGESVVLSARDRLVLHGPSTLRTQNITQDPVIAAVLRVE